MPSLKVDLLLISLLLTRNHGLPKSRCVGDVIVCIDFQWEGLAITSSLCLCISDAIRGTVEELPSRAC